MKISSDIVLSVLGSTIVLSGGFIYLLLNLEKLEKGIAIALKYLSIVLPVRKLKNNYTAVDIQSKVNSFCEEIEKQAPGVMPAALKVQFVSDDELKAYATADGKTIILRMNYDRDRNKLLASASYLYIKKGFLIRPKLYIGKTEKKSIDLSVTKRLLRNTGAISSFIDEYVEPQISEDPNLQALCHKIDYIDEDGFFYEVFVRVMLRMGNQLYPKISDVSVYSEISQFIDFLYAIASKRRKEKVPLSFKGKHIKAGIILVKEDEIHERYGDEAYVNRYVINMQEGIDIIFLKGIDEESIKLVRRIVETLDRRSLIEYEKEIIRPLKTGAGGYKRAIYVYSLPDKNAYEYEQKENEEEIIKILNENIPSIAAGDVEILGVARVKDVLSKVLVKSLSPRDDPAALCLGENNCHLEKVWNLIGHESVEFIRHSENMGVLIREAIFKRFSKRLFCEAINIDGFNKYDVIVPSDEAMAYALGNKALHKRLADKLLGIQTFLKSKDENNNEWKKSGLPRKW